MGEVSPLNEMYRNYRDKGFEFLTIYVREPHPGEHYGPHKDFEQKLEYAKPLPGSGRHREPPAGG